MYSFVERLRSLRHQFWYGVSERLQWSRGTYHETPAGELQGLPFEQSDRIAALRTRYQLQFESRMSAATARNNYEYLDILDRAWSQSGAERPVGGVVCDIGCASFWYAQTLQTFFRARQLIGVEVEGYRLFKDGRTRIDYASGHLAGIDNASFVVADYRECTLQADTITAWFPFVTATAILAWRLPLSLLAPESIFERVYHNLNADGRFVMVNHGSAEALRAGELCESVGLSRRFTWSDLGVLSGHRAQPTVLSCWSRGVK